MSNALQKLSPSDLTILKEKILLGMTDNVIAGYFGVTPGTFYRWKELGNHPDPAINYRYREFATVYNQAKAQLQGELMSNVVRFAQKDWRASAWALEKLFPEELNPTQTQLLNARFGTVINKLADIATEDFVNELCRYLAILGNIEAGELPETANEQTDYITVEPIAS